MERSLLTVLLLLIISTTAADPADWAKQLYAEGGQTLYCETPFTADERYHLDFIYNKSELLSYFGCITEILCKDNTEFQAAYNDLHNLYAITTSVATKRIGTFFGEPTDNARLYSDSCPIKTEFQNFTPPDNAKGNVARAMLYMTREYGVPLRGSLSVFQAWNKLDPPDQEEINRNTRIKALQGKSNPYIENPKLMDEDSIAPVIQFNFQ